MTIVQVKHNCGNQSPNYTKLVVVVVVVSANVWADLHEASLRVKHVEWLLDGGKLSQALHRSHEVARDFTDCEKAQPLLHFEILLVQQQGSRRIFIYG